MRNSRCQADLNNAPDIITSSPSLKCDVEALAAAMFSPEKVPQQVVISCSTSTVMIVVYYGFGNASGTGLGCVTFTCGSGFNFQIGVWDSTEDPELSNWKEFTNIIESLEDEEADRMDNC